MFESKNYREKTSGGANAFGPTLALMLLTTLAPPVLAQSAAIRPCKTQSADEQTATCLEKADVNETLIDEKLPADAGAETLLQPYASKIRSGWAVVRWAISLPML